MPPDPIAQALQALCNRQLVTRAAQAPWVQHQTGGGSYFLARPCPECSDASYIHLDAQQPPHRAPEGQLGRDATPLAGGAPTGDTGGTGPVLEARWWTESGWCEGCGVVQTIRVVECLRLFGKIPARTLHALWVR